MIEFKDIFLYVLPAAISFVMLLFLYYRRQSQMELRQISREVMFRDREEEKDSNIEKLILRGDVELRVLEEITENEPSTYFFLTRGKSRRELILDKIQRELRRALRNAIDSENFEEVKERIIVLLDQISKELKEIQQRIPFEGLEDPERSLLIDLIEEIDASKQIPRQKAEQLAEIIKVKHQDNKKLQLENAKSAVWTRWGTAGTISFGLLSLALSIYTIYM